MTGPLDGPADGPLDGAFAAMAGGGEAARLRFHQAFAATPLWLVLDEAAAGSLRPRLFQLEDGPAALAFDSEDRLARAFDAAVDHATLPGRALAAELGPKGIHLALNPGAGGAETVLDAEVLNWVASVFAAPVAESEARAPLTPPRDPDPALLEGLGQRVQDLAAGIAEAWLAASGEELLLVVHAPGPDAALIVEDLARTGQFLSPFLFSVAPAAPGSALLAKARGCGIGLLNPD